MNEPWPLIAAFAFVLISRPVFGYVSRDPKWRSLTPRAIASDPARLAMLFSMRGEMHSVAIYAAYAIIILFASRFAGSAYWIVFIAAILGFWSLLFVIAWRIALARSKTEAWWKQVKELQLEACTKCGYALKGLPAKHRCPECGKSYDLYHIKLEWSRRIKRMERDAQWDSMFIRR